MDGGDIAEILPRAGSSHSGKISYFNCFLRCCFDSLGIILSQIDNIFNMIFVKIINRPGVAKAFL